MYRLPNEQILWLQFSSHPVKESDGSIVWDGVAIDMTERKLAELALRKNERILRLFVEHSPAAIAMFDREMCYIVASHRYLTDYRLGEHNLVGRSHYDVFPEMTEEHKEIHRRCLAGEVKENEEDQLPGSRYERLHRKAVRPGSTRYHLQTRS